MEDNMIEVDGKIYNIELLSKEELMELIKKVERNKETYEQIAKTYCEF